MLSFFNIYKIIINFIYIDRDEYEWTFYNDAYIVDLEINDSFKNIVYDAKPN